MLARDPIMPDQDRTDLFPESRSFRIVDGGGFVAPLRSLRERVGAEHVAQIGGDVDRICADGWFLIVHRSLT